MLRIKRIAYRRITELFTLDIDEDLARDITEDLNRWIVKGEGNVEVTVKMLEDVANKVEKEDVEWERELIFQDVAFDPEYPYAHAVSLYDYLADWIDTAIWDNYDSEIDGETDDWYDRTFTVDNTAAAE